MLIPHPVIARNYAIFLGLAKVPGHTRLLRYARSDKGAGGGIDEVIGRQRPSVCVEPGVAYADFDDNGYVEFEGGAHALVDQLLEVVEFILW